jgi:2-iminobutanoate/2-iminopropanoate deaminase
MRNPAYLFSIIIFFSVNFLTYGQSDRKPPIKEKFNLDKESEDAIGYTQGVKVGNAIYISGSVGWGDMEGALKHAYDEINQTLEAYHADFSHVVKENLYTTALDSVIKYKDIRKNYYGDDYPAATWVEVKRLYNPGLVVEIEVIAILPEEK